MSDNRNNTLVITNDAGTARTETHSCNLAAGSYYIDTYGRCTGENYYTITAWSEPVISLSAPTITDISSPSGGKLKVSYTGVANALKYEIQYSKNDDFSSAKKSSTPAKSFTANNLKKGTWYYARVRAYTVYNDGLKVYSNWSRAQSVYVKKSNNKIEILTGSKSFKYDNLKKKNASVIIAATDTANAKLTYKLSSVPSKVKKYFSINKADGKLT
ncbi:MAG: fibronectin type III domain-containing protein, partial [Clostridia bacterium]|nr:fibronectin type III domain-containing protein [Clostridia bacterium]